MNRVKISAYLLVVAALVYSCKKPYSPPTSNSNINLLVVEGLINTGADSTKIMLSRTVVISNKPAAVPETQAVINIENKEGTVGVLTETVKGSYVCHGLNLDNTMQYRVRIKTSNGKIYVSDFVDAKITPPIDSVGFAIQPDGVEIYASTHDPADNTHYYKYSYQETWQFHTEYQSEYVSDGTKIVRRPLSQDVYSCFDSDSSNSTIIVSTAGLSQDMVYQHPVAVIPSSSEKIETRYSILITQSALTPTAYAFWDNLERNTQNLGSIFDAQPSQLTGNIHNVADPAEPVVGYISAGTTQNRRIFISGGQLPLTWSAHYPYGCRLDSAYFAVPGTMPPFNDVETYLIPPTFKYTPVSLFSTYGGGYLYTDRECGDCTIRGTKKQPDFWK